MNNKSHKTKVSPSKENPYKSNFELEEDNSILQKSISFFSKEYFGNMVGEKDFKETALEAKINKHLNDQKFPKRKKSIYISSKEIKKIKLEQSLRDIGVLTVETENHLIVRKLPEISEKAYKELKNKILDKEHLNKLYEQLQNVNIDYKNPECNISIGGISPLSYLIQKNYKFDRQKEKEMKDKIKVLEPYVYNFRTIFGDGNCFYRAIMFRYLEILVLEKKIDILKKVVFDMIESFKSEELQKRRIIIKKDIEPEFSFKLLFLIIHLLEKDKIMEAYKILFKSFSSCRQFDYAIILYFRYILYDYIRKNENKIYLESFPISIGNLLPSQYETDSGEFLFKEFYENYLLKFYSDAEKITVYLAPFVLGIEINVIVFDIEGDILQKFIFEGKSELKTDEIISLINKRNHYEIIYSKKDEEKNKKFFEIFENDLDRNISFPDKLIGNNNTDENEFSLLNNDKSIQILKENNSKEIKNQKVKEDNSNQNNKNENNNINNDKSTDIKKDNKEINNNDIEKDKKNEKEKKANKIEKAEKDKRDDKEKDNMKNINKNNEKNEKDKKDEKEKSKIEKKAKEDKNLKINKNINNNPEKANIINLINKDIDNNKKNKNTNILINNENSPISIKNRIELFNNNNPFMKQEQNKNINQISNKNKDTNNKVMNNPNKNKKESRDKKDENHKKSKKTDDNNVRNKLNIVNIQFNNQSKDKTKHNKNKKNK